MNKQSTSWTRLGVCLLFMLLGGIIQEARAASLVDSLSNPNGAPCQTVIRKIFNANSGDNTPAFSLPYPPDPSTNWNDQAFQFQNLFANVPTGGNDGWFFKPGVTFTENSDGTARLLGTIAQYSDFNRQFDVDIAFTGRTYDKNALPATLDATPENRRGVSTADWYFYLWGSAVLTGRGTLEGGKISLSVRNKTLQVGSGADQFAADGTHNSASGWFSWKVVSQPAGGIKLNDYANGSTADIAMVIDGNPLPPCGGGGGGTCKKYDVANTNDICGGGAATKPAYAMYLNGAYYQAAGLQFTKNSDGTATLTGTLTCATTAKVAITFSGYTTTAPAGSPKLQLCLDANFPTNNWFYYTGFTGTIQFGSQAPLSVAPRGPAFQVGIGGNEQNKDAFGASGWFTLSDGKTGDFNFKLVNEAACGSNPCPDITGNTISKSCANYLVVLSGPAPAGGNGSYEYMWLKSTSGCPTELSQAIPGATGASYTLASTPSATTYFVRCARQKGCTVWGPVNESNCVKVNAGECARPNPCDITIGGNTISKSCVSGVPVVSGPAPAGGSGAWEYMWLQSVWGCPTEISQAIAGATGPSYTLPACPAKTTYFVRCARPAGCATWGPANESACVSVNANECKVSVPQCSAYDVSSAKDICGSATGDAYAMYFGNKTLGNSHYIACESLIFEQSANGTATLKGTLRSRGNDKITVNITFTGGTTDAPSGSPKIELCADSHTNTNGWVYYTGMSGTVQINNSRPATCSRRGPAFQMGMGGDLQDKNLLGACGWFTLSDGTEGDLNFRLSAKRACGSAVWHDDDLQSKISLQMNAFADYRRANIEWTNNSGENNDYFSVQRLSENGQFDDLELVSAYAPDSDVRYFQTQDKTPLDGDNYYRVKLTLRDGTEKFSEIKKVTFKDLSGVSVFPNPADDHVSIDLTNYIGKEVSIYLYSQFGVLEDFYQIDSPGTAPFRIGLDGINNGSHLVRIIAPGKRETVKQIIIAR